MPITTMALEIQGIKKKYNIAYETHQHGSKKLAVTVHGYLNHCRYFNVLNQKLIELGYDVVCMNLPGHGPSSGARQDIDRFETFGIAVEAVINQVSKDYDEVVYVAHSTGTVGMMELLLDKKDLGVSKIIFLAPLVRSYLYKLSYWGWRLGGRVLPRLPVRPIGRDVHPDYRAIVNSDPYYPKTIPNHFSRQLFNWNARLLKKKRTSDKEVHILFAQNDSVIDNNFNRWFFEEYFPNADIKTLEGSTHLFFHHNDQSRLKTFEYLEGLLR